MNGWALLTINDDGSGEFFEDDRDGIVVRRKEHPVWLVSQVNMRNAKPGQKISSVQVRVEVLK